MTLIKEKDDSEALCESIL